MRGLTDLRRSAAGRPRSIGTAKGITMRNRRGSPGQRFELRLVQVCWGRWRSTDTGYVQYEDSVELAAPRAWVSVRSELTFETGNPAVIGTYVP